MGDAFQLAMSAHKAGRLDEAAALYKDVIAKAPLKAHAHYLLGCIQMDSGQFGPAMKSFQEAVRLNGRNASYRGVLGILCQRMGDWTQAIRHMRMAVVLPDAKEETFRNLGNMLMQNGDAAEAAEVFSEALGKFAASTLLVKGLIEASSSSGKSDQMRKAINLLRRKGWARNDVIEQLEYRTAVMEKDKDKALEKARQWLAFSPESPDAMNACAETMKALSRLPESLHYCLLALDMDPGHIESLCTVSSVLSKMERFHEAACYYKLALRAAPDRQYLCGGLSYALYKTASDKESADNIEEAHYYGCRIHAIKADDFRSNVGLSSIMLSMLRVREGLSFYARSVEISPQIHNNTSSRLFHDNYAWFLSRDEVFRRHLDWARVVREQAGAPRTRFDNVPDPDRRLKVGFVSADFSYHPVSYFFMTVFQSLLKHFDIYLYSNHKKDDEDAMTNKYRDAATCFRNIDDITDEELQKIALEDRVDVMFDLSGHTTGNRLTAFALRLAPVQVEWLGYPNTTGLDTMDYRISDDIAEPEGEADKYSSERIVRLPGGFHLYRPTYKIPADVSPLPALKKKIITFGSFNNLKKASPLTFAAWARLMKEVPGSRMVIKDRNVDPRFTRERVFSIMASHGISPSRITIKGMQKNNFDHMKAYHHVDIALDCFPYNGTTTTCEALVMGCPVVTMIGDSHVSRVSASILTHVGHPEWIAHDEDQYVSIGCSLASDLSRLSEIRSGLREQMFASHLCDTGRMEREMSDAIRHMWRQWCASL